MTKDEAIKVIEIMLTADGGCSFCAYDLCTQFGEEFPEFKDLAMQMWEDID